MGSQRTDLHTKWNVLFGERLCNERIDPDDHAKLYGAFIRFCLWFLYLVGERTDVYTKWHLFFRERLRNERIDPDDHAKLYGTYHSFGL